MMTFNYSNPTNIIFGQGQITAIQQKIPASAKVLLLYGGGSIKDNGIYQQVTQALSEHSVLEFSGITPNPTVEHLDKAVDLAKAQNITFILAVGGGSVIDGAKYVAAAACYNGTGWDILEGKHTIDKALPIGCILTLPATGSESNTASVVSKAATQDKLAFLSPAVQPQFAVLDPDAMKTLPARQLANGIADAWVHTCEQYLTVQEGAWVQDGYAEALLKTLLRLANTFGQQDDQWRANLMWSANQALNGLIGAGVTQDWATHMIGHELTALYGVDHARSLAIIQPSLLRNQLHHKQSKLEQMGKAVFGLDAGNNLAERTIDAIEAFYHKLDIATQLTDYGNNKQTAIEAVLTKMEAHGLLAIGEHQSITLQESRAILQAAIT